MFAGGALTAVAARSGRPTCTRPAATRQLLVSSDSTTVRPSSAHATKWYVPIGMLPGTTPETTPLDDALGARLGMVRPPSSLSSLLRVTSSDR